MNRDIIGGKWQQIRGKVKEEWESSLMTT